VFWDAALTIPAANPVRTVGGYPSRAGTASRLYVSTDTYSITVRNRNSVLVFSAFNQSDSPTSVFNIATQLITATAQQVTFTLTTFTYLPGTETLEVYRNGLRLNLGLDYLETNSSVVTLTTPAALGDQFLFQGGAVVTGDQVPGSDVSFIQAGTGAVTRNMQDKARESVSVLDFGAVGDGIADDTTAIQAALNTGKSVYIPYGTYKTSIPLQITNSKTQIIGDGAGSIIAPNFASGDVFVVGNGSTEIAFLTFDGFLIWPSVVKTSGYTFNCRFVVNSNWNNVFIGSTVNHQADGHRLFDGIYFDRFSQCIVNGGEIITSNHGIKTRGNADQSFGAELSLDGALRIAFCGGKAVWIGGASGGVYLDRVDISVCNQGVYCDSTLQAGITNREVFLGPGCTIDLCSGYGINLEATSVTLLEVNGVWVSACGNATTGQGGIRIAPSAGVSARWSNIRVNYCYGDGVAISDGAHVFSGGFIKNCGTGTPGGHGMLIATLAQATVTGMEIHNNGNATRGYGIRIEGTVTNYNIQSNAFFGNGQLAIYQPSGPSLNQLIRDNRGWVTENSGFANIVNGTTSVVVNHGLADVPTLVQVTAAGVQDAGAYWFVAPSSFTATQFTLIYSTTAGAQRDFSWRATRGQA
jgi:hypothetical protein